MPFVKYTPLQTCITLVNNINTAKTQQAHDQAVLIERGYRLRCDELRETWPGCELDYHFEDGDRPMCCGEYLDWEPEETS